VNRIGDRFFDQVERTGHGARLDDIDRLAELGIRRVRYPILWERAARDASGSFDFTWADERMQRLRELGMDVIVGLVHHGSGPRGTHLLDEAFPEGLARFAAAVARRYPWVEDFTPINEPLTTARFSGLYGHWYPHQRDDRSFVRALVVETRATILAMRAIRRITPSARLVQTEDLGTVSATPLLTYQAKFENRRRWLSFDLLYGRVTPVHPLHQYLVRSKGTSVDELSRVSDERTLPSLIGINYYLTSDRFLDERVSAYPAHTRGHNGRHVYADIESVRVEGQGIMGHRGALELVGSRYPAPVALTEVHLGCSPEEQVAWLAEAYRGAEAARSAGVDVRAVTAWSLFGSYDWDSLLTQERGHYEPGAFDCRSTPPQPTLVAHALRRLAKGEQLGPSAAENVGWWRRPERILYPVWGGADQRLDVAVGT
jgi:dTDP-4-dehydrorhamnose reductase